MNAPAARKRVALLGTSFAATITAVAVLVGCANAAPSSNEVCDKIASAFATWEGSGSSVSETVKSSEADEKLLAEWNSLLRNVDRDQKDTLAPLVLGLTEINEARSDGSLDQARLDSFLNLTESKLNSCQTG